MKRVKRNLNPAAFFVSHSRLSAPIYPTGPVDFKEPCGFLLSPVPFGRYRSLVGR